MADTFSPEHLARLRDDARRLATRSISHEGEMRSHLVAAEANLDQFRTALTEHGAAMPAGFASLRTLYDFQHLRTLYGLLTASLRMPRRRWVSWLKSRFSDKSSA